MKLRIARKIDKHHKPSNKDKRTWWLIYRDETLVRAIRRLRRSWRTANPMQRECGDRMYRKTGPDWFASNRIESMLIRQPLLRKSLRAKRGWKVIGHKRVVLVCEQDAKGVFQLKQH